MSHSLASYTNLTRLSQITDTPTLTQFQITQFQNYAILKMYKRRKNNILEMRAKFFLPLMEAQ
jgi:hypothetical protein